MKALLLSSIALLLAACATTPAGYVPRHLFADRSFPEYHKPVPDDLFGLSDEMREFIQARMADGFRHKGQQDRLAEALKGELRMEYEATATTPAALTFASRSGNCLSLVILTAAFAKHLGMPFQYQTVYGPESWSRAGTIAFLSGHVNVKLGSHGGEGRTVDFLTPDGASRRYTQVVREQTIVAMYRNNRAAESLVDGHVEAAYWWARSAIEAAPDFVPAYNTLGVVYLYHRNLREAEDVLRHALVREPENTHLLGNLANVLERAGRVAEAQGLRRTIAQIDPYPPFHFLDRGLAALGRGDAAAALESLHRELRRMPYNEEVHFAIAQAELRLGDLSGARRHLALAAEYSTTRDRRGIYGAKLRTLTEAAD